MGRLESHGRYSARRWEGGYCHVFGPAPIFAYLLGKNLVAVALPMTLAMVAGHQVELSFTVANADRWGDSKCRTPVELEGLPFLFDTICRVRDDVRMSLLPGKPAVVTGRGTSLGLFAESLSP